MNAYPQYKDSGIPWLGKIPKYWELRRAKNLFTLMHRPTRNEDEVVTCFRDGVVTLRKNRRVTGFTTSLKEIGYQGIRKGDLVIHQMDAFAGAIGVSDSEGKSTPVYVVCTPVPGVNSTYYANCLRYMAFSGHIESLAKGIRERSTDFRYETFSNCMLPVPPQDEQIQISRYLDWQTSKINKFIKAKRKLLELLCERRCVITDNAIRLPETQHIRLGIVTRQMGRSIDRRNDEVYTPIGLYNRGRGIFHKQPTKGSELGESTFYEVKENDLVFSGQFAWEGAVAIASINDDGCIASHRYPIFRGKEGIVDSAYLLAFFRTDLGDIILNHHSRGAAGRNRPLNPRTLMKEKIPIPPLHVQKDISDIVRQEIALRQEIAKEEKLIQEYRTRLVSDVVTGKVDVRFVEIPDFDSVEMEQEVEGDEEAEDELITESIEE